MRWKIYYSTCEDTKKKQPCPPKHSDSVAFKEDMFNIINMLKFAKLNDKF